MLVKRKITEARNPYTAWKSRILSDVKSFYIGIWLQIQPTPICG